MLLFVNEAEADGWQTTLPQVFKLVVDPQKDPHRPKNKEALWTLTNTIMLKLIPLWNALRTATDVLGSDMPMASDANKLIADIRDHISKGEQTAAKLGYPKFFDSENGVHEQLKACVAV